MGRYVLRFQEDAEEAQRFVAALAKTRILDSSRRMFLVEGPEEEVRPLAEARKWIIAEQVVTPPPQTPHPRVAPVPDRTGGGGSGTAKRRA